MNVFKSLLLAIVALVVSSAALQAAKVTYTIGDGGSLKWNGWSDDHCSCYDGGEGCKMTITTGMAIKDNGTTWDVSGQAEGGLFDITDGPSGFQLPFGVTNYTFPSGYYIIDPNDFPDLAFAAGTRINLAGAVTDDRGYFSIQVPKAQ